MAMQIVQGARCSAETEIPEGWAATSESLEMSRKGTAISSQEGCPKLNRSHSAKRAAILLLCGTVPSLHVVQLRILVFVSDQSSPVLS